MKGSRKFIRSSSPAGYPRGLSPCSLPYRSCAERTPEEHSSNLPILQRAPQGSFLVKRCYKKCRLQTGAAIRLEPAWAEEIHGRTCPLHARACPGHLFPGLTACTSITAERLTAVSGDPQIDRLVR